MKIIDDVRGSLAIFENFDKNHIFNNEFHLIKIYKNKDLELITKNNLNFKYFSKNVTFDTKRIFFLFNVPSNIPRGDHAHIQCSQFLVSMFGKINLEVFNGTNWINIELIQGDSYLLKPLTWIGKIWFENNAVLAVFCSHKFKEADYIRSIDSYTKLVL